MDVVLIDSHEATRDGLEALLERRGIRTLGSGGTGAEAIELLRESQPDVAVIPARLPDQDGLRLIRRLRREHPDIQVLVYTAVEDVKVLAEALECGARGFVLKLGGTTDLIRALRLVAQGERYVDPAIRALIEAEVGGERLRLTKREREVFDLLAQGLTGEEIAARLSLSPETVRTHIRNGMEKLDAHTRAGAVAQALKTREIAF